MFKKAIFHFVFLTALLSCSALFAQLTVDAIPNPKKDGSGWVSNPDHIINESTVSRLNEIISKLDAQKKVQIAVALVDDIGDAVPKEFATALFRKWGVGDRQTNNGLLILLVKNQRRIEFEVGYGLEGVLPDVMTFRIQQQHMVPLLKQGNYDAAILEGVIAVEKRLLASREELMRSDAEYISNLRPVYTGLIIAIDIALFIAYYILLSVYITSKRGQEIFSGSSCLFAMLPIFLPMVLVVCTAIFTNLLINYVVLLFIFYVSIGLVFASYFITILRSIRKKEEPDRVVRYQELVLKTRSLKYYALIFPVPLLGFVYLLVKRILIRLRYAPYYSDACEGRKMQQVTKDKKIYLSADQQVELELKSVSFDIWKAVDCDVLLIIPYADQFSSTIGCGKCKNRTAKLVKVDVQARATFSHGGLTVRSYECEVCHSAFVRRESSSRLIQKAKKGPMFSDSGPSSGGWGGSSSGGSSSSSSSSSSDFGGGSSGGGGSGSSW